MKKILTILLLLINSPTLFANDFGETMQNGNELYANNQFAEALVSFNKLIEDEITSYSLYFNLGCTYFKLDSLAQSIYYLEKAKQLNPSDEDLNHNLSLAYGRQQDDIDKFPELFLVTFFKKMANILSSNLWLILSLLLLWFAVVHYYLKGSGKILLNIKNLYVYSLFLGLACFLMAYLNYTFNYTKQEAIVFSPTTIVYKNPNTEADNLIEIHEGLKVAILDEVDQWYQIKMTDNTIGWLNKSDIRLL